MEKLTDTDIQRLRDVVRILGLDHQEYDVLSALITILEGRLWDVSHAERQEIDHATSSTGLFMMLLTTRKGIEKGPFLAVTGMNRLCIRLSMR